MTTQAAQAATISQDASKQQLLQNIKNVQTENTQIVCLGGG